MRSDDSIGRELHSIATWNGTLDYKDPNYRVMSKIAFAVYDTLRWARGKRVTRPTGELIRIWEKLQRTTKDRYV